MSAPGKPKRIRSRRAGRKPSVLITALCGALAVAVFAGGRFRPNHPVASAATTLRDADLDDIVLLPAPTRNIARGERLSSVSFTTIKWPKSRLSGEYLTDPATHGNDIASTPIPKFLPVPLAALSQAAGEGNPVTVRIRSVMGCFSFRVFV